MKKLFYACFALVLTACGDKVAKIPADQLASNDFESIDGWVGDNVSPSLTKEKAHSGRYAIKVDPNIEYSMGYSNQLGRLSASKLHKIKVHAWVNIPATDPKAVLVVQVTDPTNPSANLLWNGINLAEQVKARNKWVEIEKEVVLPDNLNYAHKIGVYLWRTSVPNTVFMDDLTISKVE